MKPFTYNDYIYYLLKLKDKNSVLFILNDKKQKYRFEKKELHQPHDKIFKEILDDKNEAIEFLNKNLKIKNTVNELKEKDIEKYNRKFITQDFFNIESDVIYKKVDEDIFFLIEHQSKIDYAMPYRILKYNMEIIDSAIDRTKINTKDYKIPAVYSFVIYTGNQNWNVEKYITDKQRKLKGVTNKLFAQFEVIDINKYSDKELLESNNLLEKVMLLEKATTINEFEENLLEILNKNLDKKQIYFLRRIINYIVNNKIDTKKYNEIIIKKLEGGESRMNFVEMVRNYIDELLLKVKTEEDRVNKMKKEVKEDENRVNEMKKEVKVEVDRVNEMKNEVKEKENELQKKEKQVKQKEENINNRINKLILNLIKSKVDDKTIEELFEINKTELLKIKRENHIIA